MSSYFFRSSRNCCPICIMFMTTQYSTRPAGNLKLMYPMNRGMKYSMTFPWGLSEAGMVCLDWIKVVSADRMGRM